MDKIREKLEAARRLAEFLFALAKAFVRLIRRALGLADEGADLIMDDLRTAWRGAKTANETVGRGLDATVGEPALALARTAGGAAIGGANFVGKLLGGLLPQRPASPSQLAAQVAAADTARTRNDGPAYSPPPAAVPLQDLSLPALVRQYAGAGLREGGEMKVAALHLQRPLPTEMAEWLKELEPVARMRLAIASPDAIERHLNARSNDDLIPGVPRGPKPVDLDAALAAARASFRAEKTAIAAGISPAPAEPEARPEKRPFDGLDGADLGAVAYAR
ncbi:MULTISPECIES: hypothetical protein [Methylobacterium]|jgi:hypothetical protein|uniref:Uncharacterized protein n=1 Tax=Methylobacterium aquaticum TaxID=270351 RepID=A0A0C6FGA5_9HYPH|nr:MULTISPECIES: hypothetical protein [Methylobacterium]NGM37134.1 hypothetical protein [Methylobacterium sp. DB0501]BAQ47588.1 hypothetical protein Maq22A_c23120 [Methylobacterium aquaticum]